MSSVPITDADIQAHTAGGSYERGQQYVEEGTVQSLTLVNDQTLKAKVQGSDVHPYVVQIRFNEDTITKVECTCPYHAGSWCKHIAAVLLKTLEEDQIPQANSAAVVNLVTDLNRDELVHILKRLAAHDPDLLDQIERECERLSESSSA